MGEASTDPRFVGRRKVIVTDGVFSMEGTICKLPEIVTIAKKYRCTILLDESHSLGCVGPSGLGVMEMYGMRGMVDVVTGTLGKSLGSTGGFMVTTEGLESVFRYLSLSLCLLSYLSMWLGILVDFCSQQVFLLMQPLWLTKR